MNGFHRIRPSQREALEARAAAWIAQRDAGFSAEEAAEFKRWCEADPLHAAAVNRLEAVWASLQELRDFRPEAVTHPDPDLLAPAARRHRLLQFPVATALATLAAAVVLVFAWMESSRIYRSPANATESQSYSTTTGGYQRVALADGSVVEMNANSQVRVHYSAAERRATLLQGEAHFIVASNPKRPFWVDAGNVAVRAVGTAFNVRRAPSEVEVLVTAGRVQVDRDSVPLSLGPSTPVLAAGWRAVIAMNSTIAPHVEQLGVARMRDALAWQSSRLVFVDTPLAEAIEEFNRRNDVQVSLADPDLGSMPIGGSFNADNVESFVRLLSSNGDIQVERPAPDRIVLRRPNR